MITDNFENLNADTEHLSPLNIAVTLPNKSLTEPAKTFGR